MLDVTVSDGGAGALRAARVEEGSQLILRLAGSIDLGTAEALEQWIEATQRVCGHVVLDMAGVDFIDSTGLRVLLAAKQRDGVLVLRNVKPGVRLAFQMGGIAPLLLGDES